jgi:amino acid adenylation domain-containing protein
VSTAPHETSTPARAVWLAGASAAPVRASAPPHRFTLPTAPVAETLAALAAVLHRRREQEIVRVAHDGSTHELAPDGTTFRELTEQVRACTADPDPARSEVDASVGFGSVPPLASLRVTLHPGAGATTGVLTYEPARHDAIEVGQLADQWAVALADGVAVPRRPVAVLTLAGDRDRELLCAWSGSGIAAEPARAVHLLVGDRVRENPDAVAVTWDGGELSYGGLDRAANTLAAALIAAGAGPERLVALVAERSPELIVGLLAVLKTGAAYTCIEPDVPSPRMQGLLADSGAVLVLVQDHLHPVVGHGGVLPAGAVVIGLSPPQPGRGAPDPVVAVAVPVDAPAYLSYTSGSTGRPKGAVVPHRAVARLVRGPEWLDHGRDDRFLQLAPLAFDASTLEVWAPLTAGGRIVLHPPGPVDLDALARTLVDHRVTLAWLTAGLFHQMVTAHPEAFAGVRQVLAGGDVVSAPHVARLLAAHPGLRFTNGYGPTENTTFTACWTSDVAPVGSSVPIGRPVTGTRVLVLDPDLAPVPAGVPGELYAAGAGLARGYLDRPAATAERFLPEPGGVPGARMYRTGDRARWNADGTLEFLGRADRQLKVQGYRVEPGEIEATLGRHPDVGQAVVVAQADGPHGKRLLAYVTATNPEDDDPVELARRLRSALREELPAHMVPWAVVALPQLPLTRNGKVDRDALPAARRTARSLGEPYAAPSDAVQSAIAEEWGDLLGIEPVGVDDDFFALGGHSLVAAELLTRLGRRFGIEIAARTLYLRPTVAELAEAVTGHSAPHR